MAEISNRSIDTFLKVFCQLNMVDCRAVSIIPNGESRLSTMKSISIDWKCIQTVMKMQIIEFEVFLSFWTELNEPIDTNIILASC